jgi:hypothetical protein
MLTWTKTEDGSTATSATTATVYDVNRTPGRRHLLLVNGQQIGKAFATVPAARAAAEEHDARAAGPETTPTTPVVPEAATVPQAEAPTGPPAKPRRVRKPKASVPAAETPAATPTASVPNPTITTRSTYYAQFAAGGKPVAFRDDKGKIATVVKILKKAGKTGKPVDHAGILAEMVKAFGAEGQDKMAKTIRNQVPCRLRLVRGIHVWSDERGYWIDGEGAVPQPAPGAEPVPDNPEVGF